MRKTSLAFVCVLIALSIVLQADAVIFRIFNGEYDEPVQKTLEKLKEDGSRKFMRYMEDRPFGGRGGYDRGIVECSRVYSADVHRYILNVSAMLGKAFILSGCTYAILLCMFPGEEWLFRSHSYMHEILMDEYKQLERVRATNKLEPQGIKELLMEKGIVFLSVEIALWDFLEDTLEHNLRCALDKPTCDEIRRLFDVMIDLDDFKINHVYMFFSYSVGLMSFHGLLIPRAFWVGAGERIPSFATGYERRDIRAFLRGFYQKRLEILEMPFFQRITRTYCRDLPSDVVILFPIWNYVLPIWHPDMVLETSQFTLFLPIENLGMRRALMIILATALMVQVVLSPDGSGPFAKKDTMQPLFGALCQSIRSSEKSSEDMENIRFSTLHLEKATMSDCKREDRLMTIMVLSHTIPSPLIDGDTYHYVHPNSYGVKIKNIVEELFSECCIERLSDFVGMKNHEYTQLQKSILEGLYVCMVVSMMYDLFGCVEGEAKTKNLDSLKGFNKVLTDVYSCKHNYQFRDFLLDQLKEKGIVLENNVQREDPEVKKEVAEIVDNVIRRMKGIMPDRATQYFDKHGTSIEEFLSLGDDLLKLLVHYRDFMPYEYCWRLVEDNNGISIPRIIYESFRLRETRGAKHASDGEENVSEPLELMNEYQETKKKLLEHEFFKKDEELEDLDYLIREIDLLRKKVTESVPMSAEERTTYVNKAKELKQQWDCIVKVIEGGVHAKKLERIVEATRTVGERMNGPEIQSRIVYNLIKKIFLLHTQNVRNLYVHNKRDTDFSELPENDIKYNIEMIREILDCFEKDTERPERVVDYMERMTKNLNEYIRSFHECKERIEQNILFITRSLIIPVEPPRSSD